MDLKGGVGLPGRLARLLQPASDPAAERLRDGRIAALLWGLAALYMSALLIEVDQHRQRQVVLIALVVVGVIVQLAVPWHRLPDWARAGPVLAGLTVLTVGCGLWVGAIGHYTPLYPLILSYCALVLPPGRTAVMACVALAGLAVVVATVPQQHDVVRITTAILVGGLTGELIAAAAAGQRKDRLNLQRLHDGLGALLTVHDEDQAADLVGRLAADLLAADGVSVLLREQPGSPVMVGVGGQGLGAGGEIRIDIDAEPSGAGICAHTARSLFVADAPASPLIAKRFATALHAASILYLPILARAEVLGVVVVWWSRPHPGLDTFAEQAARLLSVQAGPVLGQLRRIEVLDRAALTDALTGVGNRRAYEERLVTLADDASLVVCDLDHFKQLNDSQGHPAGDRVLRSFAATAVGCVRRTDLVARTGGDEFVLVLDGGEPAAVAALAKLREAWTYPEGVGFSAGRAVRRPGEDVQALSERADQALYEAKRESRRPVDGP